MRVTDLSDDVAGGFCAKLLAMGGAEVLRPAAGAPGTAAAGGAGARAGTGTGEVLEEYLHHHKHVVDVDPTRADGRDLADLVASSDVVVTSFDAGRYTSPLDDAAVRRIRPAVVHLTTSSFGTRGPRSTWRGGSLVDWAAGGYLYITGDPAREPLAGPENLCGYVCGYTAAIAVHAALIRRARTGAGSHLDVSVMESMLSVHQSTFSRLGAGVLRVRTGRFTEVFPLVVEPCRDGYVSLGIVVDEEFDRLAVAMDLPELAWDDRFSSKEARQAHAAELDEILVEWLAGRDADDVVALLRANSIAAAKVASATELLANPQLEARRFWDVVTIDGRQAKMPGNPIVVVRGEPAESAAPPDTAAPPSPSAAAGPDAPPLGGPRQVVVLDLTAFWAGPSATRNLADLGARVIRVERPRSRVDFMDDSAVGATIGRLFDQKMNRNKESVVVDLKSAQGRELLLGLVPHADILVENFRAGVMESLGLGRQVLAERNPGLVYVALSGFGSTGPWSSWRSYGPTIEAASSIEGRTGYAGGPPLRLGHTLPDGVGGLAGTLAALAGLHRRRANLVGSYFDVSQLECTCVLSGESLLASSITGGDVPPCGNASATAAPHGVYRCKGDDEWVAVDVDSDDAWSQLVAVVGDPELADPDLASIEGRIRRRHHVDTVLGRFTAARDKASLAALLQQRGIRAFPVMTARDLVLDEQLEERGYFVEASAGGQRVKLPGSPFCSTPPLVRLDGAPPRLGEHTVDVLTSLAGLSEEEVEALRRAGVVATD